jgi:threonine/homoserine/homoserine lactone efflux protein
MDLPLLIKGLMLGFSIAAPVGPIGILCIRRTLAEGRLNGLVSGLGAASADAFYGALAGFGLSVLTNFLVGQQFWLRLVGGSFLIYLAVRTFLAPPAEQAAQAKAQGLFSAYTSTLFLTLSNPMTILSFVAMFAGLGLDGSQNSPLSAASLVLGVFLGSALWWLLLSSLVSTLRRFITPQAAQWVNRLSGLIILAFGLFALLSLLR